MIACKDCIYCDLQEIVEHSRCLHPGTILRSVSVVTADEVVTYKTGQTMPAQTYKPFCENVRSSVGYCTMEAKLFKAKECPPAATPQ